LQWKLLGKKVFKSLLKDYDYKLLRAFINDQIRVEPLESGRLVHLTTLLEAVDHEINYLRKTRSKPGNVTLNGSASFTFSESESDPNWRGPRATPDPKMSESAPPARSSSFFGVRRPQPNYHYKR